MDNIKIRHGEEFQDFGVCEDLSIDGYDISFTVRLTDQEASEPPFAGIIRRTGWVSDSERHFGSGTGFFEEKVRFNGGKPERITGDWDAHPTAGGWVISFRGFSYERRNAIEGAEQDRYLRSIRSRGMW